MKAAASGTSPLDPVWAKAADALPIIVWTALPDGRIEFVNRRWEEGTGVSADSLLGTSWLPLVHPGDRERTANCYSAALLNRAALRVDARLRRGDGSYQWMRHACNPVFDGDGNVVRWVGVMLEIDEAFGAQQRFRALAEAVPVIVWIADASGAVDWYSARWFQYTGQTQPEALGWGWQAAHHPDDFLEVMTRWPRSLETGEPLEIECRLRRYDGVYRWFLMRAEPLRADDGSVLRWYGSLSDIDAQKTALERSKRVSDTLQDAFLPKELPQLPGVRFDAVYIPAERDALVGGDWFDAFTLPDERIGFSIGDVAGHGLDASILVGRLRQAIFTLAFHGHDPARVLGELDAMLRYQEPETFVTALVGFIDAERTNVTYACAGHPAPLVAYRNDEPAHLFPNGDPPLGLLSEARIHNHLIPIRPHAVVALYTDGMIEFSRDLIASEAKLRAAVSLIVGNVRIASPARAVQEIVLGEERTTDDAALLLIQFAHVDPALLQSDVADPRKTWRFHSSNARAAHLARQQIVAYLRRFAEHPEEVFTAELIVGEILANTAEHAPGLVEVRIDWSGSHPVLVVRDTGPGINEFKPSLPSNPLDENGRGLFLVSKLANEVSVHRAPGYGTEVRVVLPLERRAPAESFCAS